MATTQRSGAGEDRRGEGTTQTSQESARPVWKDHNLHVVWGVTLMAVLGTSSVTPAFPEIARELGVSAGQVVLLITFFTLPGVVLTPVAGVLSDRFGRKRILVPSLLLFGIAGGACALVRDFHLLLGLRALQGAGAAALGVTNVILVGDLFSGQERTEALGYNSSILSIGTAGYPAVGGALATFAWYYPFALPLVAVPIAFLVLFSLHNPEPANDQGLKDYFGNVWEHVKDRRVVGLFAGSLVNFVLLYGALTTYLPILMNEFFGASPFVIGVVVASASLTTALASSQMGRLSSRFSEKGLVRVSFLFYAVSLCIVPLAPNVWSLLAATVVFGAAQSLNLPNSFSLLTAAAPKENRGAFLSVNSTILRLGQTVGPLFMAAVAAGLGLGGAYFAAAALAAAMCLLAFVLIR